MRFQFQKTAFLKCREFFSALSFLMMFSLLIACSTTGPVMSQSFPDDLSIELSSAPRMPGYPLGPESIFISPNGTVELSVMDAEGGTLPAMTTEIDNAGRARIYNAIMENDFFGLKDKYESPAVLDGDYALLKITANGKTHSVRTINMRVNAFDRIVIIINREVPTERRIIYNALHVKEYLEVER